MAELTNKLLASDEENNEKNSALVNGVRLKLNDVEIARLENYFKSQMPLKWISVKALGWLIGIMLTYSVTVSIALFVLFYDIKSSYDSFVTTGNLNDYLWVRDTGIDGIMQYVAYNLNSNGYENYVTETFLYDENYVTQTSLTSQLSNYASNDELIADVDSQVDSYLSENIIYYQPSVDYFNFIPSETITITSGETRLYDYFLIKKTGFYKVEACILAGTWGNQGSNLGIEICNTDETVCNSQNTGDSIEQNVNYLAYTICWSTFVFASKNQIINFFYIYTNYETGDTSVGFMASDTITFYPNSTISLMNSVGIGNDFSTVMKYNGYCDTNSC